MSFEATIIKSLQSLRVDEGVTPAKLGSDPLLMQLLKATDGADGVTRLTALCAEIPGDARRIATMNALALDYPARGGIEARRAAITTHPHGGTAEFPFSTRTHRRREDEGFAYIAWALLQAGLDLAPGTFDPWVDLNDEQLEWLIAVKHEYRWDVFRFDQKAAFWMYMGSCLALFFLMFLTDVTPFLNRISH